MTTAEYFFILTAVYLAPEMSSVQRFVFGVFCAVAGCYFAFASK